ALDPRADDRDPDVAPRHVVAPVLVARRRRATALRGRRHPARCAGAGPPRADPHPADRALRRDRHRTSDGRGTCRIQLTSWRPCSRTCSSGASSASRAARTPRGGRTSSRPRASSSSPSGCATWATCRRSRANSRCRSWPPWPSMAKLRLNKILAQAGLGSRRRADGLIAEGHVAVNGVVTRNHATLADPAADRTTVDDRPLPPPEARHYLLLNKPRGYV